MAHTVILAECQFVVLFVAPCWLGIQNVTSVNGLFSFPLQKKGIHIPPNTMECALFLSIDALQVYCTLFIVIVQLILQSPSKAFFESLNEHATAATI